MLIEKEKGAALDFRRPQVYGRNSLNKLTETARFPNKRRTFGHVAARYAASSRLKPCKSCTDTSLFRAIRKVRGD